MDLSIFYLFLLNKKKLMRMKNRTFKTKKFTKKIKQDDSLKMFFKLMNKNINKKCTTRIPSPSLYES